MKKNTLRKYIKKAKIIRYYVEYLFSLLIFKIFSKMSVKTASNVCGTISKHVTKIICKINGRHEMAMQSLSLCFPEKTEVQKEQILDKLYENIGRFVGEYITQDKINSTWLKENVELVNTEIAERYFDRGFFGITGHFFGNWELLHHFLKSHGQMINVIYRKQNNTFIEEKFVDSRPVNQIPKGSNAMRQIMGLMKNKKIIGILIDQRDNRGDRFPFFGMGAKTGVAIQRLSLKYDYKMICAKCIRKPEDPTKFTLTFFPPLEIEQTGNIDEDINRLTQATLDTMETWIRENPEQWFWIYNRWK